jgi:hypothetical protein
MSEPLTGKGQWVRGDGQVTLSVNSREKKERERERDFRSRPWGWDFSEKRPHFDEEGGHLFGRGGCDDDCWSLVL